MIILFSIIETKDPNEDIGKTSSSVEAKENIRRVLKLEYMSSEDEWEDENGDPIFGLAKPRICWSEIIFDKKSLSIQTSRSRRVTMKRVVGALYEIQPPAQTTIPNEDKWILNRAAA